MNKLALALLLILLGLAVPHLADALGDPFLTNMATRMAIMGMAVASLGFLVGFAGLVSFGHAAFFGIGAYVVAILFKHHSEGMDIPFLPFAWEGSLNGLVQLPLAFAASFLFALLVGALSLRTKGVFFIMITLAFAQMLYHFMISLPDYGGEDGLSIWERSQFPGLDLYDDYDFYYLCFGLLVAVLLLLRMIIHSSFGVVIRAASQDEARLATLGVPVFRYRLLAFALAGGIAGLSGALAANLYEFSGPGLMHWSRSGEMLVMLILGGMGSLFGGVAGAIMFIGLEEILAGWTEHWAIILGPILILVVLFARGGLMGLISRGRS